MLRKTLTDMAKDLKTSTPTLRKKIKAGTVGVFLVSRTIKTGAKKGQEEKKKVYGKREDILKYCLNMM